MNRRLFTVLFTSCLLVSVVSTAIADVKLPAVIGSDMVLQRGKPLPIWGWADAGESVSVSLAGQTKETKADDKGTWKVTFDAIDKSDKPLDLTVKATNTITLKNILIGEIWVCSGQSNMQWSVNQSANAQEEAKNASHPNIRLFHVPRVPAGAPAQDVNATWAVCSPQTVGGFSAVAYYYGRALQKDLNVPIGLIHSSWGGTRIEPWIPVEGFRLNKSNEFKRVVDSVINSRASYLKTKNSVLDQTALWLPKAQAAAKAGAPIPDPPKWPTDPVSKPSAPTGLYNGMIHPVVPYAVRGAIWYQGESNRGMGMVYHELMKSLVGGWRQVWRQKPEDFAFYYVQLAPYNYRNEPLALPEIWEAQTASLSIPNTGMVVTTDIGNVANIHPTNKQEVGRRLALWALAKTYGKKGTVYSGPLFKEVKFENGKAIIKFDHIGGGLTSRDDKSLTHFALAGDDKLFTPAKAEVDLTGDVIIVQSDGVAKPVAVRFGWDHMAEPNLMNKEGLPASPFRTDKW